MTAGLLDTSVVVDWHDSAVLARLPELVAVSTVTLAELAVGPLLAASPAEAARRQARLQEVESLAEPLPFDSAAARSYGQVVAAVASRGRSHRRRIADLMIAATAHAHGLSLYTRNPADFAGVDDVVTVVAI